ncbi:protein arginine N-methyltransferase 1-like [Scaptodrosophila lebanonensis]|uniref:Protein arginine N-methyltransferase 1-like n=1 Tax=Drosophila lebanonensis TaxID=7225 RepID=A0A6J2T9J5_DROLE|nr:protein arginine N-methyltransferase 1-like [Scaptodrosophila lebanonensis]
MLNSICLQNSNQTLRLLGGLIGKSDCEISPETYATFLKTQEVYVRDRATMLAFKDAMEHNAQLFKGSVVLEVGCGSGILSMWAARQGAKRVIAVEPSDIAQVARQLVVQNRLDNVIQVFQAKIELLKLPGGLKCVDIILSKWMGACLMYNSVIEDVIYARNKWLRPGGSIFPQSAKLYVVATEQDGRPSDVGQRWAHFGGLNLSRIGRVKTHLPEVTDVDNTKILTKRHLLRSLDMRIVKHEDLSFEVPFRLRAVRQAFASSFVVFFDFEFPGDKNMPAVSTSPSGPSTQWKQSLFPLDAHLPMRVDDVLKGNFKIVRSQLHLDFDIDWSFANDLVTVKRHKQIYRMQGNTASI